MIRHDSTWEGHEQENAHKQTTKGVWLWGMGERREGGRKKTDADYDTSGLLEGGVRVRVRVKHWLGVE